VTTQSLTVNENSSGSGNVLTGAADSEGSSISAVAGTFATANGSVTVAADGSYTYTPNADYVGGDNFSFTARTADDSTSGTVNVTVHGVATATASFVTTDTTTQGNWFGTYGADGYDVSQDPNDNIPSYAQVSFSNQSDYTWASSTSDVRALDRPENLSDRIAGTWYTSGVPSFTIDVNVTDGNTHQVALHALDWDSGNRAETIKVRDAGTGTVLDTQTLAAGSFVNGEYLVWNIQGHVHFEVDYNGGYNAVISGLFFGKGNPAPAVADAGFESPNVGAGTWGAFQYNPTGTPWTFSGSSGIAGNGSGFTLGNPNAPEGTQVAFLQMTGSFSQSVNFAQGGTFTIGFQAAQRGNWQSSGQTFQVLVDGNVVGTFTPFGTGYTSFTTNGFTVTGGLHTITFQGLNPNGGDNTAFIDQVSLIG
jgi:hypothetical protein